MNVVCGGADDNNYRIIGLAGSIARLKNALPCDAGGLLIFGVSAQAPRNPPSWLSPAIFSNIWACATCSSAPIPSHANNMPTRNTPTSQSRLLDDWQKQWKRRSEEGMQRSELRGQKKPQVVVVDFNALQVGPAAEGANGGVAAVAGRG